MRSAICRGGSLPAPQIGRTYSRVTGRSWSLAAQVGAYTFFIRATRAYAVERVARDPLLAAIEAPGMYPFRVFIMHEQRVTRQARPPLDSELSFPAFQRISRGAVFFDRGYEGPPRRTGNYLSDYVVRFGGFYLRIRMPTGILKS